MARCEDCIHYGVCAELENFRDPLWFINTKDEFCCSWYLHADVAPRAEVEELQAECNKWQERLKTECEYTEAITKKKVAREIFEEIEASSSIIIAGIRHYVICEYELAELKNKYAEGQK